MDDSKEGLRCAKCGNGDPSQFIWKAKRGDGRRYICKICGVYGTSRKFKSAYLINGNSATLDFQADRILSDDDILDLNGFDPKEWFVFEKQYKKNEGYRKDRQVEWDVKDGKVISGHVRDSGKMLVVPLFSVRVTLRRKVEEIRARSIVADLREEAKRFAPKYPRMSYPKIAGGLLYEIEIPDLQLGRLVWEEETGNESNPDVYLRRAETAIDDLLGYVHGKPIARILFPLGNDFFDTNTAESKTAHGTPQANDVRWKRTFQLARQSMVRVIDKLATLAPVDVLIIPGNHDEERIWYFGDTLASWYSKCPNVNVDNAAPKRKYYSFGKCLLGLTHGYYEKIQDLAALMPAEAPQLWAQSVYREFHLGHTHHKEDRDLTLKELSNGVVVRRLRSLSTLNIWEKDKGFGSLSAAEGFLWNPERGVIGQFVGLAK